MILIRFYMINGVQNQLPICFGNKILNVRSSPTYTQKSMASNILLHIKSKNKLNVVPNKYSSPNLCNLAVQADSIKRFHCDTKLNYMYADETQSIYTLF